MVRSSNRWSRSWAISFSRKLLQGALSEGWLLSPQTAQHHLPAQVEDGHLHRLGIRGT